ncbi:hypothetical protein C8J57DRAFT_534061 [Mycena rebaudengoi]|nr:hypothetical protein C8J57DRAFT_534061 [Mycena rebaudengoi]
MATSLTPTNTENIGAFVFSVTELRDITIDFVAEASPRYHPKRYDLRHCALVAKAWAPRAQGHLFSSLNFSWNETENGPVPKLRRLLKILETSPHLTGYIRHLTVNAGPEILSLLTQIQFNNLEHFSLGATGANKMRHTSGVIGPVQNILRQPNLRLVELMGPYESFSVISQYFQNCSPTVRHLRLAEVTATDTASIPSDLPLRRILLSHLSMSQTDGGWLRSSGCPFAFDNLTDLRIGDGAWPLSQHMLAPAFNSIQNLDIVNYNGSYPLKIAHLPSLANSKGPRRGRKSLPYTQDLAHAVDNARGGEALLGIRRRCRRSSCTHLSYPC